MARLQPPRFVLVTDTKRQRLLFVLLQLAMAAAAQTMLLQAGRHGALMRAAWGRGKGVRGGRGRRIIDARHAMRNLIIVVLSSRRLYETVLQRWLFVFK